MSDEDRCVDRCPSDYSRQRALVMSNSVYVMLEAVDEVVRAFPVLPGASAVEEVLVQLEQIALRLPDRPDAAARALLAARTSLVAGDPASAALDIREAAGILRGASRRAVDLRTSS